MSSGQSGKKSVNMSNYKIVKCKNFEKGKWDNINCIDGSCRYGNTCTFAHGETDVRSKGDNMGFNNNSNMMQNMFNPMMMDPSLLMMMQQSMGFPMGKK
jgi:hypothetical protein